MDLCTYFEPINKGKINFKTNEFTPQLGDRIRTYWEEAEFPDLKNATLAMLGVCEDRGSAMNKGCAKAPDEIRSKLYRLALPCEEMNMIDLGNMVAGKNCEDTYFALTEVLYKLMDQNITVIILGGSQDITFAQYRAYEVLGRIINMVAVDARFDIDSRPTIDSQSYLYHIIQQQPNYLFNFTNVGYQSYFTGYKAVELMDELQFDCYRLGAIQEKISKAEPIFRGADALSIDLGAIRQSDAPANGAPSPHGFYGEELCQMARYAGMSDKLSSIGIYELNPMLDHKHQTAHMVAQVLWYFIEGYYGRKNEIPSRDRLNYKRYLVTLSSNSQGLTENEMVFYKSKRSDRWWMEVPCESDENKERYKRQLLIPCTYEEYQQALDNDIPALWWKYYKRVNG